MTHSRPARHVASLAFSVAVGLSALSAPGANTKASKLMVTAPTEVPGLTLQPGEYSIHVVDHLSERYIVRIDGPGQEHSTFLALDDPSTPKPTTPGQELWQNAAAGKKYVRAWLFPGQPNALEFVYPKADAVAIAKSNNAKVPAIDPASEGKPPQLKGLSKSDLEMVTLWLLSSTRVGPGESAAGIQAERYPEVAQAAAHKPAVGRLPQTASSLPMIALLGCFSLMSALCLRLASFFKQRKSTAARTRALSPLSW